jgi:phosphoglycolate phosphatase
MPQGDFLLFDLDGTLSDPLLGISNCINYALNSFGHLPLAISDLAKYVGPPLDKTFVEILGSLSENDIQKLVEKYRERFIAEGYKENVIYKGIPEALEALHASGSRLGICTSKKKSLAEQVLSHFSLSHYFEFVSGGDIGIEKWQQIEHLKSQNLIPDNTIMIGDRNVNLTAAHKNGIKSAGVLWGYGSREELEKEKPTYLLSAPLDLLKLAL